MRIAQSTLLPVLLFFASVCVQGQAQTATTNPELLIDQIKKTIVYLQGDYPCHQPRVVNGVPVLTPAGTPVFDDRCLEVGTGFLILYSAPDLGKDIGIPLLVTSKHVIRHQRLGAPKGVTEYFESVTAFTNALTPNADGSFISPINIVVKQRGSLVCSIDNSDLEADVAVCPINIPDTVYQFKALSTEMFVSDSKIQVLRLNETDEVLFSGLFLPYHGAKRNYPIVRHGRLALIPKEKIPWSTSEGRTSMQDLYLAEVTSWGGNSGSPVFLRLTGAREQGGLMTGVQYLLLGVMQGYFNAERQAALDTAAVTDTSHQEVKLSDNSGIAAIVPASKIIEIIAQPRIKGYISIIKGISFGQAGRLTEAEASFREAIDGLSTSASDPLLREAHIRFSEFLQRSGRFPEANFQSRLANSLNRTSDVTDDLLR